MITNIKINNFKGIESLNLPMKPLSLFTGLNGMGKSTLIQALLLLRQSYQQQSLTSQGLILNGELTQIGTAQDALNVGADIDIISFEIMLSDTENPYTWVFDAKSKKSDVLPLIGYSPSNQVSNLLDPVGFSLNNYNSYTPDSFKTLSDGQRRLLVYKPAETLPFNKNTFQYLNAERTSPQTAYPTSASEVIQRRHLGKHGEYTAHFLSAFGEENINFNNLLFKDNANDEDITPPTLRHQLSAWLSEISPGLRISATEHPDFGLAKISYEFKTAIGYTNLFRPTNVGFGLSYILPVLTCILSAKPGSLLVIENPESHIHPRGQSRLGELMALAAQNDIQLFVETHSDHILNGIRVAVKKYKLDPDRIGLYFFERGESTLKRHYSNVRQPKIDSNGRIEYWPAGFFDEWNNNLMELI